MLTDSRFLFGVLIGIALYWAYKRFGGVSSLGGKKNGQ